MAKKSDLLAQLASDYGFDDPMDMLEQAMFDGVCPAICPRCLSTDNMEPDQDHGWCDECSKNTMVSALVLAGII